MYVATNRLHEIYKNGDRVETLVLSYVFMNLRTKKKSIFETLTLKIDFDDEFTKKFIIANKNTFYKAIKSLINKGVLFKYKPKIYVVNPYYYSVLNDEQVGFLTRNKYDILNGGTGFSLVNYSEMEEKYKAGQ